MKNLRADKYRTSERKMVAQFNFSRTKISNTLKTKIFV